jgi:hypothetical protein
MLERQPGGLAGSTPLQQWRGKLRIGPRTSIEESQWYPRCLAMCYTILGTQSGEWRFRQRLAAE